MKKEPVTQMINTTDKQGGQSDVMNKTMSELRMEHGVEPGLRSAANKLRQRCSYYQQKYAEDNEEDKE